MELLQLLICFIIHCMLNVCDFAGQWPLVGCWSRDLAHISPYPDISIQRFCVACPRWIAAVALLHSALRQQSKLCLTTSLPHWVRHDLRFPLFTSFPIPLLLARLCRNAANHSISGVSIFPLLTAPFKHDTFWDSQLIPLPMHQPISHPVTVGLLIVNCRNPRIQLF